MMKKIMLLLVVGVIVQLKINAQASFAELENGKVIYPSPTAASLGKYGEYPVNLANGIVNIGQDIVTVKSGRLSLNVSLSYHASGNRPSDIPGWVGLGFSLNAGGVITRVIKDLPDDLPGGFYGSNETVKYLWNNYPTSHFVEQYYDGTIDPRSDIYQFNFCGKTGEFVFDMDRKIHFKQQVPFKIEILGGLGGFGGFIVTTDDGTIYTFDQTEGNRSRSALPGFISSTSSWYLTKIKNLSGDSIVLKYTTPMNKFRYKQYSTTKEVTGSISGGTLKTGKDYNVTTSTDDVVYLDEIDFNDGKLVFGKSKRMDPVFMPAGITPDNIEEKKLDLIILKDNNANVIKQWKFEYFENSTERLKLKKIIAQASDQTATQTYSFEYNPLKFPVPNLGPTPNANPYLTNDVDYWGYYNGAANGDNKIPKMYLREYNRYYGQADRTIRPLSAQAEMLTKIVYPTGGYTLFEYEGNDYSAQGESFAADQNPMTEEENNPIPTESYEFNYDRDEGFDGDPVTTSFVLTEPTHVYIRYSCGADGPLHEWANPGQVYEQDYQLIAGTYTIQSLLRTNILLQPSSADITRASGYISVYRTSNNSGGNPVYLNAKTGPGLRIKSIETNDGIATTKRSFEYLLKGSPKSSGFLSVFPAFYVPLQRFALNLQGLCVASEPINDIGEGLPVGYSRVVERFQDNSFIEHYYTSYDDHPDEMMPFLNGYSDSRLAHMTSNDFWRGLEVSTAYYNAAGIIQKRTSNSYDVLPESITNVQAIELKTTVGFTSGQDDQSGFSYINGTLTSLYTYQSCFLYNGITTDEIFDKDGDNPIATYAIKYYDNVQHLQPTRVLTSTSQGTGLATVTSFPDDYASGVPFIDYMKANHLTAFPVEQVTYQQKGNDVAITNGNIITYKTEGAGLPDQLLKLGTTNPIPQASFKFSNRSLGVLPTTSPLMPYSADVHYQPAVTYTKYNSKGSPLELVRRDGVKTAYLWGYNSAYPVAEIIGTDYATAMSKISDQSILNSPSSDAALRAELNKLRAIPGAMVTTYTYKPLVGMTSATDPSGKTVFYEYDGFQRLKLIRDQEGKIVKQFDYTYQGQ